MIRVTIELIPYGVGKSKHLGTIDIANDGTGTKTKADYIVRGYNKAGAKWKTGKVLDFPRKKLLVFDLLYRALKDLIGDRNE